MGVAAPRRDPTADRGAVNRGSSPGSCVEPATGRSADAAAVPATHNETSGAGGWHRSLSCRPLWAGREIELGSATLLGGSGVVLEVVALDVRLDVTLSGGGELAGDER